MAKCKSCRKKKTIFRDGQCQMCWQDMREKQAREGKIFLKKYLAEDSF